MVDPTRVPDSKVKASEGVPTDSRPGRSGWAPQVPAEGTPQDEKPYLIVDLTPNDRVAPVPLDSLKITGNVKLVTVKVKTTKDGEFKVQHYNIQSLSQITLMATKHSLFLQGFLAELAQLVFCTCGTYRRGGGLSPIGIY